MYQRTENDIRDELFNARLKFPVANRTLAAVSEEFGEVAKAILQHSEEPAKGVTNLDIYKECIQLAVMAIRLAEEGDRTFKYNPDDI